MAKTETKAVETAEKVVKATKKEEDRVPYMIPYIEGQEKTQIVGLNGKMYKIQKGKKVMIPKGVASILDRAMKQELVAAERREELQKKA